MQAAQAGEYYRLNMPFELGLDVGCRLFGGRLWKQKKCLVLESERYRYQAAISDLGNSDIAVHDNQPIRALTEVRNWLNTEGRLRAPGPDSVWRRFIDFTGKNYDALKARGYSDTDVERLPVAELIDDMTRWVAAHPP
jgi:hypothetical protein